MQRLVSSVKVGRRIDGSFCSPFFPFFSLTTLYNAFLSLSNNNLCSLLVASSPHVSLTHHCLANQTHNLSQTTLIFIVDQLPRLKTCFNKRQKKGFKKTSIEVRSLLFDVRVECQWPRAPLGDFFYFGGSLSGPTLFDLKFLTEKKTSSSSQ